MKKRDRIYNNEHTTEELPAHLAQSGQPFAYVGCSLRWRNFIFTVSKLPFAAHAHLVPSLSPAFYICMLSPVPNLTKVLRTGITTVSRSFVFTQ